MPFHLSAKLIPTSSGTSEASMLRLLRLLQFPVPTCLCERCLSTVYVAAESKNGLVYFTSDSDAMITKGLARLLSMGLSGNTAEAIQRVKPEFIKVAGLQASLTAGCVCRADYYVPG